MLRETAVGTRIVLLNKNDLPQKCEYAGEAIRVSAKTGEGLDALRREILARCAPSRADQTTITNERHIRALELALRALRDAVSAQELDCAATDVKIALHHLGSITGSDVDAAVIDRIFERFCVGK